MAASCDEEGTTWFFSSCGGILELQREIQASSSVGPGKSSLPFELRGRVGDCSRVTAGKKRPHLACVQDLMFLSRGDRDLRFVYQTHPRSQSSPRGEGKDSALLSSRDGYVLESTE